MVDALVSNVIRALATIVQNEIEQEVRLVVGVKKDIEKLSSTLMKIQAVLRDAEKRQFMDDSDSDSVRLWLQDLKDVAYDIDDVLDKWTTQILRIKSSSSSQIDDDDDARISRSIKKVCPSNLFSSCFHFKRIGLSYDIGHRIKDIKERLDEIASEKDKFGFTETTTRNDEIIERESKRRLETSSLVDVSEVFGRDMDKDIIISKLVSEGSHQEVVVSGLIPIIISIVGMGGMGKTTLAQLVFSDDKVKNHFNKRIWICVSKSFDKMKVAMNIIKEIGGGNTNFVSQSGENNLTWENVHRQLTSCVDGKHFLLVLDDIWIEDRMEWDPLWLSLKQGFQGSKIIVTTRNERVADIMCTTYVHRLRTLSDEACWSLFRHYAFAGRQEEECEKLEEIGMKLTKKCNGLPLSAKTLGSLLRFKKSKHDWQYMLESDIWKVVSSVDRSVLPALLLSYNDLSSRLKQCFAFCSLIPRGYDIYNRGIIRQWMAQGLLSDNNLATNSEDFIAVGDEYFNNLVMRSFFQKDVTKSRGIREYCQMHDLIHDFAKFFVEDECFTLTIKEDTSSSSASVKEFNFNRARHLYLLIEEEEEVSTIPSFLYKAKNLRTLKIYGHIPKVSSDLFSHLKCLRTLDLDGTYLEELPKEIEKLVHLRYLDLSKARFKELPKTVTNLYNLQALCLYRCSNLCELPKGIGELVNLMDLNLTECRQLSYLPQGIGRLSRLRGLSNFIIGGVESGGCKIGELKDLNFLKDSLRIVGLGRVVNGNEAKMACLKNKQHLRALYFYFDQYTGVSLVDDEVIDEEAEYLEEEEEEEEQQQQRSPVSGEDGPIDSLRLLGARVKRYLTLKGIGRRIERLRFPIDSLRLFTGEGLLMSMEDVLESLEPHPNLEKLIIRDYPGAFFPEWMDRHANFMIFSNLVFLEVYWCCKCKQLPPTLGKLPSLETLVIGGMDMVRFMGAEFFGIDDVGPTRKRSGGGGDGVDHTIIFPKLKVFLLGEMRNLEKWDMRIQEEDGKDFIFMPCLQYLVLMELPKLSTFPQHLTQATLLRKLFIWNCPNLTWMPSPSSHDLFQLILEEDNAGSVSCNLSSMPSSPSHLPSLHIEELILKEDAGSFSIELTINDQMFLPNLKLLRVRQSPYSFLPQGLGKLASLQILDIRTCSEIESIPDGELQHLATLQELTIMRCPALKERCQKGIGEDWSKISHIPNIFIDGEKIK
ncbi:putative disease resistance protein RGA1 [Telopea speciosissima]|uniref:putative disease resistance protein RGA1 n=1 Tax=Telopea speciosissima TaxID=54955 RepID=UPI001CC5E752|nr:putative disease resistance protein RGA1 [Telopea speciosissima]